jgi:DNA replication protein DnaC
MKTAEHTNGPHNQAAEQTIRPLNQAAEKPEPQNDKEGLRAAIKDAEEKAATVFDEYQKKLEELPDSPWPEEFLEWMRLPEKRLEFHQRTAGWGQAIKIQQFEQYFREWAELPEAKKLAAPRIKLLAAVEKLEAESLAKRKPLYEVIDEAKKRLQDLEAEEAKQVMLERLRQENRDSLCESIGRDLVTDFNPEHPDFDYASFEELMAWRSYDDDRDVCRNAIIFGGPGLGKTRAMGQWALSKVFAYCDYRWITGSEFADLVSALADTDRRAEARRTLRQLAEADRLFFDDLGSAHFTPARISHFFTLMDVRYKTGGQTMFTTNHGVAEIRGMLSGSGSKDDMTLADRILRRMVGTKADPRASFFHFKRRRNAAH